MVIDSGLRVKLFKNKTNISGSPILSHPFKFIIKYYSLNYLKNFAKKQEKYLIEKIIIYKDKDGSTKNIENLINDI